MDMRPAQSTPAVVLRSWPYGESDKIVSFLTEHHGKITGIAKGAKRSRKRFPNSLEPFSLVNLRFHDDRPHSSIAFIVSADLMFGFKRLMTSLESIAFASYLVEITDGLIAEREENRVVFQHLTDGLRYLEERGASLIFLAFFELRLLSLAGYAPHLSSCRRCGRERSDDALQWHFSPRDGGILCGPCSRWRQDSMPLTATALHVLTAFQKGVNLSAPTIDASLPTVAQIRTVLSRFIQFHMGKEIKSASFVHQFSSV
jgi:DNA repair protein RecO (recombination protein O)